MSIELPDWRRYWIRRERDQYLLSGVMLASIIAGYVAASWHAEDRLNMLRNIKPKTNRQEPQETTSDNLDKLQDSEFIPAKKKVLKKYYQMDSDGNSAVPGLEEEEGQ